MRRGRSLRAASLAALVAAQVAAGHTSAKASPEPSAEARNAGELSSLREAIEESRGRLERYERDQRGLLEALEGVDQLTEALRRELQRQREEAAAAEIERARVEAERAPLEARLARSRAAMQARALALYKAGELGPVQVLFAASSLREVLERARALQLLLDHDSRLLARFRAQRDEWTALGERASAAAARHTRAAAQLEARRRDLATERAIKRSLLARVRDDRSRERSALAELEAAARALEETLDRLDRGDGGAPAPGAGFAARRGRLARPVDAPLARGFGRRVDDEFHTQLFYKGVDFAADLGAVVRAVAEGRVRFAGWFRGYGRLVILDHGESYFTVSGHLAHIDVEVGQELAEGDAIGTVGESGSLVGPRLYFEIRRGEEALDPADWFAQ
jgi:septal ring factor EnvC (AmiA/AmiB activator)